MSPLSPHKPLGRLGANVLGIDPVGDSIGTAKLHSSIDPDLRDRVRYRACTLEELSAEREGGGREEQGAAQFHAVVASEVVEHLADLETFGLCCNHVLKVCPGKVCVCVCVFSSSCWLMSDVSAVCSSERTPTCRW